MYMSYLQEQNINRDSKSGFCIYMYYLPGQNTKHKSRYKIKILYASNIHLNEWNYTNVCHINWIKGVNNTSDKSSSKR